MGQAGDRSACLCLMAGTGIKIIVGLGNPGPEHQQDRHNAGYWLVDRLASQSAATFRPEKRFLGDVTRVQIGQADLRLLKPTTYMNLSGQSVQALLAYHRLEPGQLLIVHDEIDLPAGTVRLKLGGGHGGHNGLRDVIRHIGGDFLRLRIGVGHPGQSDQVHGHVLHKPQADEQKDLDDAIGDALAALPVLLDAGLEKAQHRLHSRGTKPKPYRKDATGQGDRQDTGTDHKNGD